jgi:hypothetical protein
LGSQGGVMNKEGKALRRALMYPKGAVDYRRFDRMIRNLVHSVREDCAKVAQSYKCTVNRKGCTMNCLDIATAIRNGKPWPKSPDGRY